MDKLLLLVGASGSGKSTMANELLKCGIVDNIIQSYTTRPKRTPNERGHIFVYEAQFIGEINKPYKEYQGSQVIALTAFDGNTYWATKDQYQGKGRSVYIVDPKGVKDVRNSVKDAEVITVYVNAEEGKKCDRMVKRYKKAHKLKHINIDGIKEIKNRLDHDGQAFKCIPCDYCIDNNGDIDQAIESIKEILEG